MWMRKRAGGVNIYEKGGWAAIGLELREGLAYLRWQQPVGLRSRKQKKRLKTDLC